MISNFLSFDGTDDLYKLEDEKRRCAAEVGRLTKSKRFDGERQKYENTKKRCEDLLAEHGNDRERKHLGDLLKREIYILESGNARRLEELAEQLFVLLTVLKRVPEFLCARFDHFACQQSKMNDQTQARSMVEAGRLAMTQRQWERLDEISNALYNLLPSRDQQELVNQGFTGVVK